MFDALLAAYIDGTPKEFLVLDAAVTETGAQGPRAFCEVLSLNLSQELESSAEYEVSVKPTYHEESGTIVEPEWFEVSGT